MGTKGSEFRFFVDKKDRSNALASHGRIRVASHNPRCFSLPCVPRDYPARCPANHFGFHCYGSAYRLRRWPER